mmetsp:Transcript_25874/g.39752  ORF Transcript_25874/g.39752 Transcript_25874/m.39752 type:complete len:276 (+) Transcript_25874:53-880(+)
MGRKRNQGKARKAAKAKANEEGEEERGNDNNNQTTSGLQQSLAAQLQQVVSCDTTTCRHGVEKIDKMCIDFVDAFRKSFYNVNTANPTISKCIERADEITGCLIAAQAATMDEFFEVWNDSAKMESVISYYLCCGTQSILDCNYDHHAREVAALARYFEQYLAVELHQTQATICYPKITDLFGDSHTLVKFFRRRIPCSCLDQKYGEVKSITKMSFCFHPQCNFYGRMLERKKTMYCSRCRSVAYCSRACQKADSSRHKFFCDHYAFMKLDFELK